MACQYMAAREGEDDGDTDPSEADLVAEEVEATDAILSVFVVVVLDESESTLMSAGASV